MFDFYERRKARNILYSKPILVILVIIVISLFYSVSGVFQKERETRITKGERETVLFELDIREEVLQSEIDRLNTERGIEAEIRAKYEVARDGEKVIVIIDAPKEEPKDAPIEEKGFFKRLFGL